jgi:ABC-type glycerol-3-phosphate transport system substrate-binding protein
MRHVLFLAALSLPLSGCFSGPEPLPPNEALATAAARIDLLLENARKLPPAAPRPDEAPEDPSHVLVWFYAHPAASAALGGADRVEAFNRDHPGITLERQFIGDWAYAVQKLTVSLAAGDLPDIAYVKRGWMTRLASAGLIAPLDQLLPPALLDDLRPTAKQAFTMNGHLYALPADGFCDVLFYNRDLLGETPPATWDALADAARGVTPPTDSGFQFYPIGDLPFLESLWSAGGRVCDSRRSGLKAPEALESLQFILSLRDEGLAYPQTLGHPEPAFGLFARGRVAMTVAPSNFLAQLKGVQFDVGVAPVPGKAGPISAVSDNAIVVFVKHATAKSDAIIPVLDYLTGPGMSIDAMDGACAPIRESQVTTAHVLPGVDAAYRAARGPALVAPWSAIEAELERHLALARLWRPEREEPASP